MLFDFRLRESMLPAVSGKGRGEPGSECGSSRATIQDATSRFVTELNPNDILLGRGAPIINYQGNVRFRELVSTRKAEYIGTGRHQIKDEIARQIVEEIRKRNGKFLRKIGSPDELQELGVPEGKQAWAVAEYDVAIEKVKQALRDKDPLKKLQGLPSYNVPSIAQPPEIAHETISLPNPVRFQSAPAVNPEILALLLQQQQNDNQRELLAILNRQHLEQQYYEMLRLQQLHTQSFPTVRELSSLGAGHLSYDPVRDRNRRDTAFGSSLMGLTNDALRRQDTAIAANLHAGQAVNPSYLHAIDLGLLAHLSEEEAIALCLQSEALTKFYANQSLPSLTMRDIDRSRSVEDAQLVALAALREQEQMDLQRNLVLRNLDTLNKSRASQFGIAPIELGRVGGTSTHNSDSLVLAHLREQMGVSALVASSSVAKMPSSSDSDSPPVQKQRSVDSDGDHKRRAVADLKAASSSSFDTPDSGKEASLAKKPRRTRDSPKRSGE